MHTPYIKKRLINTPKVHFLDTGVACGSLNATSDSLKADRELLGHLLEAFVFCGLKKQASWVERDIKFFCRDNTCTEW